MTPGSSRDPAGKSGFTPRRGSVSTPPRRATTRPAFQPGARPPDGGWIGSVSTPARTSSHEISELEFHMSPVCSSSRPHTGVGTDGTRSRTRCARARSFATRIGLATASFASGMEPPRHRRISYRNSRNRPAHLVPTGPSATTPRSRPRWSGIGADSITNRPSGTSTSRAEWRRAHRGRCSMKAVIAS